MSVDERLTEIAAILARGVLRLHRRHALGADGRSNPDPSFHPGSDLMCPGRHGHMDVTVNANERRS
jgi:hypothetical protein